MCGYVGVSTHTCSYLLPFLARFKGYLVSLTVKRVAVLTQVSNVEGVDMARCPTHRLLSRVLKVLQSVVMCGRSFPPLHGERKYIAAK